MNKKFFTFVLAATGVILLSSLFAPKLTDFRVQEYPADLEIESDSVLFVIDYGNSEVATYSLEIDEETTVFSLLKNTADKENISLETQQYDFGVFVKSLDGLESTAEKAWIYYVNNESGTIAADQMKIKPSDVVEWKYITPSE